jgi:hypothetical protein
MHILFSIAHGTFYKIDHILGHKENLNKWQKIEIISFILSAHKEWNQKSIAWETISIHGDWKYTIK